MLTKVYVTCSAVPLSVYVTCIFFCLPLCLSVSDSPDNNVCIFQNVMCTFRTGVPVLFKMCVCVCACACECVCVCMRAFAHVRRERERVTTPIMFIN